MVLFLHTVAPDYQCRGYTQMAESKFNLRAQSSIIFTIKGL